MSFLDSYEPVEDRIRAFWEEHPEGRIVTEITRMVDGDYIFRAEVYRLPPVAGASMTGGVQLPDATGYAHDSRDDLPASMKSSALEVCETSAIGRALANLGYAPKGKRPSREEMSKASEGSREGADSSAAEPAGVAGSTVSTQQPESPNTSAASKGSAAAKSEGVAADSYGEGGKAAAPSAKPIDGHNHPGRAIWKPSPKITDTEVCVVQGCNATATGAPLRA